jgi:hypothetical protein
MDAFKQLLTEAFSKPYFWDWAMQTPKKYTAKFSTDDAVIGVRMEEKPTGGDDVFWTFAFITLRGAKGKSDIDNLNNFDAFRTLATVIEIFQEFLKKVEPDQVVFSGKKSDGKSKLYTRMLRKFRPLLKKFGYSVDTGRSTTSQFQRFAISKNR